MDNLITLELSRDCEAVQIPVGNIVVLPAGTTVDITQTLGGAYTVRALDGLFQISAKNADALGIEATAEKERVSAPRGPVDEARVWDTLRTCYDPEIPVNIVDLGLIYDLGIEGLSEGGSKVFVKMTLTAQGCGMGPVIAQDAQTKVLAIPGVEDAHVEIVWDPPWHQSMITPAGRKILGLE